MFANGDITSPQQAGRVLEQTGAAGIMIGRAAQGRPWLCGHIAHYLAHGQLLAEPDREEKAAIMLEHLRGLYDFYGEFMGLRIARKHIGWYLQQAPGTESLRRQFNQLDSAAEQEAALENYFNDNKFEEMAA